MMASSLARRALQSTYTCRLGTNTPRHIHTSFSTQESWFGKLFRGSNATESPETSKLSEQEQEKSRLQTPTQGTELKYTTSEFVAEPAQPAGVESTTASSATLQARKKIKRTRLTPARKQRRFDEHISFMEPRLGRNPSIHRPLIRKTTWIRVLGHCQTEEQLKKVMEMIPLWRDMGHDFDTTFSHAFIRRCLYLKKPEFALELFGNFGKYNVPLTQTGARELLNTIYYTQPIDSVIVLTSLFNVYKLQPVAEDLSCCAMVIAACLKSQNKDAQVIADALLPHLKTLVKRQGEAPLPKGDEVGQNLPLVWGIRAVGRIDELLPTKGSDNEGGMRRWLHSWRVKSGHVPTVAEATV